jgi:hypothetical protein
VKAEPAPGNMTKRMMELQALLEMSERLPVPPQQIIEKMDISATDKITWLEYINAQQAAASEEQEEMKQLEIQFKDREIKVDETKNEMDFLVDMSKIKQMAHKDEVSTKFKYDQMERDAQKAALQFAADALREQAIAEGDDEKAEHAMKLDAAQAALDLTQDAAKASQDLYQDAAKHVQDMQFIHDKNAILLKAAKDKQEQALLFAKQKARQGVENGKGKPSNDAKD